MNVPIPWTKLGSPTRPGDYSYGDCIIRVRERDIQAVNGDPDAIVKVSVSFRMMGPPLFLIGAVEHPDPASRTSRAPPDKIAS